MDLRATSSGQPKTKSIPRGALDYLKPMIVKLLLEEEKTNDQVREILRDPLHGCVLTYSQLEHQLRVWGVRKKLNRAEWWFIFGQLDMISACGRAAKVEVSGCELSVERLAGARKTHLRAPKKDEAILATCPADVSIKIKTPEGTWEPYSQPSEPPSTGILDSQHQDAVSSLLSSEINTGNVARLWPSRKRRALSSADKDSHRTIASSQEEAFSGSLPTSFQSSPAQVIGPAPAISTPLVPTTSIIRDSTTLCNLLKPIPQITSSWRAQTSFAILTDWFCREGNQLVILTRNQYDDQRLINEISLVMKRTLEEERCGLDTGREIGWTDIQNLERDLRASAELLPNQPLTSPPKGSTSQADFFRITFPRLLVYMLGSGQATQNSVANKCLYKSLPCLQGLESALLRSIRSRSCSAAYCKALAEGLFQVAIENQNLKMVRQLLSTHLVDVNHRIWLERPPLEMAAKLGNLALVQVLLDAGADPTDGNLLDDLLLGPYHGTSVSPQLVKIAKYCLNVGGKVSGKALSWFFQLHSHDLMPFLLEKVLENSDRRSLICSGGLSTLINNLDDDRASKAVEQLLPNHCNRVDRRQYRLRYKYQLEEAFLCACEHDHLKVVLFLSRLVEMKELVGGLIISIQESHSRISEAIWTMKPDLFMARPALRGFCTVYAASVDARDWKLVNYIEHAGLFKHLDNSQKFRDALFAVARCGDTGRIKKLLENYPQASAEDIWSGLRVAISGRHEETSWCLLNALEHHDRGSLAPKHFESPTYMGAWFTLDYIREEIGPMEFLEEGSDADPILGLKSIIGRALVWDNSEFLETLLALVPHQHIPSTDFAIILFSHGLGEYDRLVQMGITNVYGRSIALTVAMKQGEEHFLQSLLESIDFPSDIELISAIHGERLDILEILVSKSKSVPQEARPQNYGAHALDRALCLLGAGVLRYFELLLQIAAPNTEVPRMIQCVFCLPKYSQITTSQRITPSPPHGTLHSQSSSPPAISDCPHEPHGGVNMSSFVTAIERGDLETIHLFMDHGAVMDMEPCPPLCTRPLHAAIERGLVNLVELVLRNGANVGASYWCDDRMVRAELTPLAAAARKGNTNIAALLLEYGADVYTGEPLWWAARDGNIIMVEFLWNATLDFGQRFSTGDCEAAVRMAHLNGFHGCADRIEELIEEWPYPDSGVGAIRSPHMQGKKRRHPGPFEDMQSDGEDDFHRIFPGGLSALFGRSS